MSLSVKILPSSQNQLLPVIQSRAISPRHKFGYAAANYNRINADWRPLSVGPNHDLRFALETVRNRARDLVANDDYAKGYIRQMKANVVGPFGFTPKFNPTDQDQKFRDNCKRIKEKWFDFCEAENCTLSGDKEFLDIQNLLITYAARDGEFAVRIVRDKRLKFGFTLQMLQIELLDELYNEILPGNRAIILGVEYDLTTLRKIAYWFRDVPLEQQVYGMLTRVGKRIRIPAEEVIFGFDAEFENQSRGISWLVQTMSSMRMLSGYDEATLTNARMRATFGGFIKTSPDSSVTYKADEDNEDGSFQMKLENGVWKQLPAGLEAQFPDNDFPAAQYPDFVQQNLRRQSVGLGVAGSVHSGNYSDVNFSSERARQIAIRDNYMLVQEWLIRRFHKPIGKIFMNEALLTGEINYPLKEYGRYTKILWSGRRWAYVNPQQEWAANQMAWDMKAKSVSQMISESDSPYEPEEVFAQCAEDIKLAEKYGFEIVTNVRTTITDQTDNPDQSQPPKKTKSGEENALEIAKELLSQTNGNGKHK